MPPRQTRKIAKRAQAGAIVSARPTSSRKSAGGKRVAPGKGTPGRGIATKKRATVESMEMRRARALRILKGLKVLYPDAECALHHESAWQLLVATILSAQSTDETVNKVTPELFAAYPTPAALAAADPEDVQRIIYQTGFFRQKSKSIQGAARVIVERFEGEVPDSLESLVELPGVARKTANVVLGTWFGKNEGVVVDTHIGRLATRLGLTWRGNHEKDAVVIETDLQELFPRDQWTVLGHSLIWHGRRICTARKPKCPECALAGDCPSAGLFSEE